MKQEARGAAPMVAQDTMVSQEMVLTVGRSSFPYTLPTTPCTRCHGEGTFIAHSNQGTGIICFRCHGRKYDLTRAATRALAALPAYTKVLAGEYTYLGTTLYRVESVRWIALGFRPLASGKKVQGNVAVAITRMSDKHTAYMYRLATEQVVAARDESGGLPQVEGISVWSHDGDMLVGTRAIRPTEEQIGTDILSLQG